MKALIFNSGTDSRRGKLTEDKPKCLLPLPGGETILSRQLRLLAASGIRQAVITTGAYTEQIRQQAEGSGLDIILVENPLYRETNYIYSMHLAQEAIQGSDLLMLHGDLVFDTQVLEKLLKTPGNRCWTKPPLCPPRTSKGGFGMDFCRRFPWISLTMTAMLCSPCTSWMRQRPVPGARKWERGSAGGK